MNRSKYNRPPFPQAMLKENEAILKTTLDVVKKEKDTLRSGQTVVLEPKVIPEKSLKLKSDVDIYLIVGE